MINKSKLVLIAAVAGIGIASPAFAQIGGYDPSIVTQSGLDNVQLVSHNNITAHRSGRGAFAMVPRDVQFGGGSGAFVYDPSIATQR